MNPETGVKRALDENMGGRQVRFTYSMPQDVTLEEADEFFRELEVWFAEHREEWNAGGEFIQVEPGFASIQIFFEPPRDGDPPYRETGQQIFEQLPEPPGWDKRSDFAESDGGRSSNFPVFIYGDDHSTVQAVKQALVLELEKIDGVVSVLGSQRDDRQREELALSLDPVMSERLGISAGMVGNTVGYALRGSPLPRFHGEDREIDVWIRYQEQDREELDDLLEFKVPTKDGASVPIRTVTNKSVQKGETVLVRNNKRVAALV